jgi:Arc/MetJ family transcription regulator
MGTSASQSRIVIRDMEIYTVSLSYILAVMAKHLIDLDEEALNAARAELGTATIKETVNVALQRATQHRGRKVAAALDILANADLDDRVKAWR